MDDLLTSVRFPFVEGGRSEDKQDITIPKDRETTQKTEIYPDSGSEWWREWDRAKEALNLETNQSFKTIEKQLSGENP